MVKIDENGNKVNVWTESRMETTTLEIPSFNDVVCGSPCHKNHKITKSQGVGVM